MDMRGSSKLTAVGGREAVPQMERALGHLEREKKKRRLATFGQR